MTDRLADFKARYPTDGFLREMEDRSRNNRALMNLATPGYGYVGVVCLSEIEFLRLVDLAKLGAAAADPSAP